MTTQDERAVSGAARVVPIPLPTDGAVVAVSLPRERLTVEEYEWLLRVVTDLRRAFVEIDDEKEGC